MNPKQERFSVAGETASVRGRKGRRPPAASAQIPTALGELLGGDGLMIKAGTVVDATLIAALMPTRALPDCDCKNGNRIGRRRANRTDCCWI